MTASPSISIAIIGSGGSGALTTVNFLLEVASSAGWHGLFTRTLGPQIRGGEAAGLLRLAVHPVDCPPDQFDLIIGIDWLNAHRFGAEIKAGPKTLVISDPRGGEPPPMVTQSGAHVVEIPMKEMAKSISGGRPNMIALGIASRLLGFTVEQMLAPIAKQLSGKGAAAIEASRAGIKAGFAAAAGIKLDVKLAAPSPSDARRWLLSGNEATALGAIRGGVRFAAAYPITPATEILEWLSPSLAKVGGILLQAEDELAAINMIIGSSYGGTPALTATSGPGLSLMIEAIGLATASEIPIVVVDVMRGGPSTGIPTKSEQTDLNIAIYGLHGDAPHLVLAPQSVADCLFTTQWATYLAEALQTPAIVLSDQFMGQARAAIERPADVAFIGARAVATDMSSAYKRYALAPGGVSAMAIPGTPGGQYTADGLTHSEFGIPTSSAADHLAQLDKRRDKLERFNYGDHWASIEGSGELALITWGSLTGAAREAVGRAAADGVDVRVIAPRLLAPVQPERLAAALDGVKRILVVEQTHSGQFHRYLRAHYDLPAPVRAFHRPGPLPITAGEIHRAIMDWR
ncbi:2-oxoacid:acceptor oxidoreductase subunit alpha [Bradyrhizobium sp.]|uniref:2-oxoacid:acceptor oxidoreductase subunit alpha n=1 Tax=Bradyrhizobium sp. TaxID=376 RepID=UPI0023A2C212|nr:2-oxoacid:acceptor oxidoreductase subunit alpha [Bradyrhizobium sp.]MDE2376082.1 2-oxoacid:acceptor oxidoreductase subunit alpha [Bradyrhizobium sp.]